MLADVAALTANVSNPAQFIRRLAKLAAASNDAKQRASAIDVLLDSSQFGQPGLTGFLDEAVRRGTTLKQLREKLEPTTRHRFDQFLLNAKETALATDRAKEARCEAIDLLAYSNDAVKTLLPLATSDPSQDVRLHAISALAKSNDIEPWKQLLADSAKSTPAVQRAVIDCVFASVERTSLLLDMIGRGELKATVVDLIHGKLLFTHQDAGIKQRAERLLASAIPADREQALATYRPALDLEADARQGKLVFEKRCSVCHRIGDVGVQVAPDISDSRDRTPIQILTDVLQPNRAVDSNYFSYTATTVDGRVHTGVLASESSNSVTLKQQEGKSETILRSEIEELRCDGISLMPEGLEKDIPPQEMADLISFIKNWRYLDNSSQAPAVGL
jgi:putative heme-binding domain-containing protein